MASDEVTQEAIELLNGALRKAGITKFHARELGRVLDGEMPYEIALQAHFEGLLYAGVSAQEKLTLAVGYLAGVDCEQDTNRLVRGLIERPELEGLGRDLGRWLMAREDDKTLVEHARKLRNAATHRFYDKRASPPGEWYYEIQERPGRVASGLVLGFAEAYARHVEKLEPTITTVAARWQLRLELVPIGA